MATGPDSFDRRAFLFSCFGTCFTVRLELEKREAKAWSCFRADFVAVFGAAIPISDFLRETASVFGAGACFDPRSILIMAEAKFVNSVAPGVPLRSSISMIEHMSFWLSWISLPFRLRSKPWNSKPNPARTRSSFLFRQNEKLIRRSSSSCTIWMICLLELATATSEEDAFAPRLEPNAGRCISVRM